MKKEDQIFEKMAQSYLNTYGKELYIENDQIKDENKINSTSNMDKKVFDYIKRDKKAPKTFFLKYISVAATILVCIVSIQIFLKYFHAVEYDATSGIVTEERGEIKSSIIPLNFDLPDNYSISKVMEDDGSSIYFLDDEKYFDHVFLSLKLEEIDDTNVEEYEEILLNDHDVYIREENGYNSIRFSKDGISYFLSNQNDLTALLDLTKTILS